MYARTSTWTGSADALEKWVEHVEKSVAPMVAGLAGNAGAFFFADRSGGRALTLTLWDSEDAAAATDLTADQSRDRTVAATGVELEQRGRYAVVGAAGANGGQQRAETSAANKALSRRFTELFSSGDQGLAERVLAPDVVFHGTAGDGELRGIDALKRFVAAYRAAFPDARSTVEDQIAEGDKVVTRWRARGTHRGALGPHAATGRGFAFEGVTIERIADGKIAEVWVSRDELGLLGQLGRLPEAAGRTR